MTLTDSSAPTKQKKGGLKELWARVKATMSSKSSESPSTIREPIQSEQKEVASIATPTISNPNITDENTSVPKPEIIKEMETPTVKVYSVPKEAMVEEDSKITIPALDAIEVDETDNSLDTFDYQSTIRRATNTSGDRSTTLVASTFESLNKKKFEQAQAVFDRYGIPLDDADWQRSDRSGVERVERKARMRVRYTCHSCQTAFGRDKICTKCSHDRGKCTECVRYPAKRTGEKSKRQTVVLVEPTVAPISKGACHECKTDFSIGDGRCQNCEHEICERCLRETVLNSPSTATPV